MIQNIEHFGPELQFQAIVNGEIAMHSEVPLRRTERKERVASQVALPSRFVGRRIDRRRCKRGGIEGLASGILRSIKVERLPGHQVWPDPDVRAIQGSEIYRVIDGFRRSGSPHDKVVGRPTSENCFCHRVYMRCRYIVGQSSRKGVASVEIGGTSVLILQLGYQNIRAALIGTSGSRVDRMGPRIGCQGLQAAPKSALELDLEGIVVRGRRIVDYYEKWKGRCRIGQRRRLYKASPY